jgi:hypothetical protein
MTLRRAPLAIVAAAVALAIGAPVRAQFNTCEPLLALGYSGPGFVLPGDIVRVRLTFGAGLIVGGTHLAIRRVRFELDCDAGAPLGLDCSDDGAVVAYGGDQTITHTCTAVSGGEVIFSTAHGDGPLPNQVVFTASSPVGIPASSPDFCFLEFDVLVLATSGDLTPLEVEQATGFSLVTGDAGCDNGLDTQRQVLRSFRLCPPCDDDDACTLDYCNQSGGGCESVALPCDDENACTTEFCHPATGSCEVIDAIACCTAGGCNAATGACEGPPTGVCDDGDPCTIDHCDPASGRCGTGGFIDCDDGDRCTDDRCDPAGGCFHVGNTAPCDDGNLCTVADTCHRGVCAGGPALACDDGNACTLDSCDPVRGCRNALTLAPDRDGDGYGDALETRAGCSADDPADVPPQPVAHIGRPGGAGDVLLSWAVPSAVDVRVATDPSCATTGACAAGGFCTAGRIGDACTADVDCDQPPDTCRLVVNAAAVGDLALRSATLDGIDLPGLIGLRPGCARKLDVTLPASRPVTRLKLRARGTVGGEAREDDELLLYR